MKVVIRNYDTGDELLQFRSTRIKNLFPSLNDEISKQKDPFRLGREHYAVRCGITSFSGQDLIMTNAPRVLDGTEELNLRLAVTVYPEGYLLNTGKTGYNIFGGQNQVYLASIGKRNFKSRSKIGAHIFPTMAAVLSYVQKHRQILEYMVNTYGYHFPIEPTCSMFAPRLDKIP